VLDNAAYSVSNAVTDVQRRNVVGKIYIEIMQVAIIKEKIKNVDFNFIRYIRDETKAYSNKVIFLSFLTILLCLEVVKIEELELEGIKVNIKPYVLVLLICIINLYYFLQFLNSVKIDILVTKLPNQITEVFDLIEELRAGKQVMIDELKVEMQNALDRNQVDVETQNILKPSKRI
jgi:hypothetical protein